MTEQNESKQNEYGIYLNQDGIPIVNVSFSKIELLKECPRKFFYRYVKKLEEPYNMVPNNPLICGTAVDKGLEAAIENKSIKKGLKIAEKYYEEMFPGYTEEHELEFMKIGTAIEKLYTFLEEMGLDKLELQKELKLEFELEEKGKTLIVSWIGYADGISNFGVYDIKYTKNPKAYEDSDQVHLYNYLDDPENKLNRKSGGYICAKKSSATKLEKEDLFGHAERLKRLMKVEYIPVKMNIMRGEQYVDEAHDLIFRFYDENGVANQDVNSYAKTGMWCRNCYFYELCGGRT